MARLVGVVVALLASTPAWGLRALPPGAAASWRSSRAAPSPRAGVGNLVYEAQLWTQDAFAASKSSVTPATALVTYASGLLTSFSPCAMGLLPLTLGYLSSPASPSSSAAADSPPPRSTLAARTALYAAGLAATLSALGVSAALLGQLYGSSTSGSPVGAVLPLATSLLVVGMGLNLLEVLPVSFPSLAVGDFPGLPEPVRALALGASAALIASPCSSPVLTSLLGAVASSGDPLLGLGLLFSYSLGYATPVLSAGFLSGAALDASSTRGLPWVNEGLACLLVGLGTYGVLDAVAGLQ